MEHRGQADRWRRQARHREGRFEPCARSCAPRSSSATRRAAARRGSDLVWRESSPCGDRSSERATAGASTHHSASSVVFRWLADGGRRCGLRSAPSARCSSGGLRRVSGHGGLEPAAALRERSMSCPLLRYQPQSRATLVQHAAVRQSNQGGASPRPAYERSGRARLASSAPRDLRARQHVAHALVSTRPPPTPQVRRVEVESSKIPRSVAPDAR